MNITPVYAMVAQSASATRRIQDPVGMHMVAAELNMMASMIHVALALQRVEPVTPVPPRQRVRSIDPYVGQKFDVYI